MKQGGVELAWMTNRIEVVDAKYVVYSTTSLTNKIAAWKQLSETNATLTVVRDPADPMHRTTLDASLPAQFFKVKAVEFEINP